MTETQTVRVAARTATLQARDAPGSDDDGPWTFSGIAVAAGDILYEADGTPILFTEEELRTAARTQTGEPLSRDHPSDEDGNPIYPPPTDETVGRVEAADFLDEAGGVAYRALTHDREVAQAVRAGTFDVSIHAVYERGDEDPETGAIVAENIRFRDLSVVSKGMSPSNTAEWGENYALAQALGGPAPGGDSGGDGDGADDGVDHDREGLIESTVKATLRAFNLDLDAAPPADGGAAGPGRDADSGDGTETETMGAESPVDDSTDNDIMDENQREQYRSFIVAHSSIDEENVAGMSDSLLKQTHSIVAEAAVEADGDDDPDAGADDGSDSDADADSDGAAGMEPADLTAQIESAVESVLEERAPDLVAQASARASKAEKVDAIIAASDEYGEDDREELLASADALVDSEHTRLTGSPTGAPLPGALGSGSATVQAGGRSDDDEDLDAYGTGVAGGE